MYPWKKMGMKASKWVEKVVGPKALVRAACRTKNKAKNRRRSEREKNG